jgi:U3 small nucleolar ribonucleoprotein component
MLNKSTLLRRLNQVKSLIKLIDNTTILNTSEIVSLIYRGFDNKQIQYFAYELFYNYDNPNYWRENK